MLFVLFLIPVYMANFSGFCLPLAPKKWPSRNCWSSSFYRQVPSWLTH